LKVASLPYIQQTVVLATKRPIHCTYETDTVKPEIFARR